jgi:hypothetical protein
MRANTAQIDDPSAALERELIREYLSSRGLATASIEAPGADPPAEVLRAASEYASLRLAEIEARSQYVETLHRSR